MSSDSLKNECNKILNFWKLEEYFASSDYPELFLTIKEDEKDIPFDVYYTADSTSSLPLKAYKSHNEYLIKKEQSDENLYNRANIYCGCYKIETFVEKMLEKCKLDTKKYAEIKQLTGRFYIFSVQIDLEGNLTEEGVQISPFFYAVLCMIKSERINVHIKQEDIFKLNEDVNEIFKQKDKKILDFTDVTEVKNIVFDKLKVKNESDIGLEGASDNIYACKGLKKEDKTFDFLSFYLDEIEKVQNNYENNENVIKYITSLLESPQKKIMIDSDVDAMKKWLEVDRFPLVKYPSKFSPTFMQQIAINIAISEKDRSENIFSVNGPPGTGKTTLLKEIIASNVVKLAEVLIDYGIESNKFVSRKIESVSNGSYTEQYYEIPEEIAKYGILVVSNNNGAVENVTLDLPKSGDMEEEKTRTAYFDRKKNKDKEVYFSAVADNLLGKEGSAWGLISARMGRKAYVAKVLESCVFSKKNDDLQKVTLDSARENSISWDEAIDAFNVAKGNVLSLREVIKEDQKILADFYQESENLDNKKRELEQLIIEKEQLDIKLNEIKIELKRNEKKILEKKNEIEHIKENSSIFKKLLIFLGLGKMGRHVAEKRKSVDELIREHEAIILRDSLATTNINEVCEKIEEQNIICSTLANKVQILEEKIYGNNESLKNKYKNNFADKNFYDNIKKSEESQNACPWTFDEYDEARESLFYAALQVRKVFILESKYIRRNLFVYKSYINGKYKIAEKQEMFPHLFNALSVVIPVISSTFASVGRFLKYAGNMSLGMLIIDESGQAVPQSALGALYRTRRAIVVGDPLQVEPVVTIPQVLIDILADGVGVANAYKSIENSVQTFADYMNEFNGIIGKRQVGCPLLVHRRCIEPMFSISNMISYDNRMFNKTNKKEDYLKTENPFLIKKSGWINVEGVENSDKDHFVENQANKVCQLIERAVEDCYSNLFETEEKIFIITPFRTVAESMRRYVISYFSDKRYDTGMLLKWTKNCIGTVHTFQGKDANEVLLVLGGSDKSEGAMNWVVNKANILNVACTRAKYRIAFIGNIEDWKNRSYFKEFIPNFIDIIDDKDSIEE